MLISGDVALVDLGVPAGHEAGFVRPAVIVTAAWVLQQSPRTVHVVPLTTTLRDFASEVPVGPDGPDGPTGLQAPSAAQCQHLRAVDVGRLGRPFGRIGPANLAQIRNVIADLLDL